MSSLESAIRILQSLSPQKPTLRVSDTSVQLDMPKSTVSRLMKTLSEGGLLERLDDGRQYSVGPLLLQLGGLYASTHNVLDLVDKVLVRLIEKYGFTGYAGILEQGDVVILRQWQGSHPLRLVLDVGSRFPAVQTALGLSLLSGGSNADIEEALTPSPRHPVTGAEMSQNDVMVEIESCRKLGWIEVPCATAPGITAIGAVVRAGNPAQPSIGLSISFPDHAADRRLRDEMVRGLLAGVNEITGLSNLPLRLGGPRNTASARI